MAHMINLVELHEILVVENEKARISLAEVVERRRRRENVTPQGKGCARIYTQRIFQGWRCRIEERG